MQIPQASDFVDGLYRDKQVAINFPEVLKISLRDKVNARLRQVRIV